jgi:two-component system osmolarity sensor histidine kinase EnvZ
VIPRWPRTLFVRTALLIASTLAAFSVVAWAAIVWTTVIPVARATADVLAQRTNAAIAAYRSGAALPDGVALNEGPTATAAARMRGFAFSFYLINLRRRLQENLPGAQVFVARSVMPTTIWIRTPQIPRRWLVLTSRLGRPETPMAVVAVIMMGAVLALVGAALFARRLTAPLADLVEATERVAEGERVSVNPASGPSEVRSLAIAFQTMSHRLAEIDEQRELMLAGLSHDLRSPLARVRVAIELLDPRDTMLAQQMAVEVEEIDRIVGQFLHYVRAGYRESPVKASADELVRETLAQYASGTQLHLELSVAEPRMLAVEGLRHILLNLVQNAFEYGQPPVVVRTRVEHDVLQVSVEDRGAGLSDQDWRDAIRPFQRLRATPGTGHTGLGLAMVDRLVQASRGTLSARRIEGGFVVEVTLATTAPCFAPTWVDSERH